MGAYLIGVMSQKRLLENVMNYNGGELLSWDRAKSQGLKIQILDY